MKKERIQRRRHNPFTLIEIMIVIVIIGMIAALVGPNIMGNLDKAKQNLEDARAAMTKPFERAQELADMQKRLEFVNAQLSMDSPDEPMPVSETPDDVAAEKLPSTVKIGMVSVAVPTAAFADRPKPQIQAAPQENKSHHTISKLRR